MPYSTPSHMTSHTDAHRHQPRGDIDIDHIGDSEEEEEEEEEEDGEVEEGARAAAVARATQHILMRCGGRRTVWPAFHPDTVIWEVGGKHPHIVSCLMEILDSAEGVEWATAGDAGGGAGEDEEGGGMVISPTPPSVRDVSTLMGRVVLLDDDWRNIEVAMKTGVSAVHLRAKNVTVAVAEVGWL